MFLRFWRGCVALQIISACVCGFSTTRLQNIYDKTTPNVFGSAVLPEKNVCIRKPTRLFNVPPPSMENKEAIKDFADREGPPQSFYELQINSARAAKLAINDGFKLLEIEFPPLPANVLEMDDVSAYEIAEANTNLAIQFAKSFSEERKVAILLPDEAEANIQIENLGTAEPSQGVTISSLRKSAPGDDRLIKPEQIFLNLFGGGSGGQVQPIDGVNMYVIIVASAQELPDIEELVELDENDSVFVLYNLKLDVLRGDLGAPAFPPKSFQDRFLSRVKPVYYLRTRQYSRSTPNPPYIVNYQGCLFRSYPGQYQTLLDIGTGKYKRVGGSEVRPALGQFKQELTDALVLDGVIGEEGSVLNFLRTGYKTTTWWEEDREDASNDWKT